MVRPLRANSSAWSSLDHAGTRLPFAITTSGPSPRVRKTPIGLPDCTTSVWPSSSACSAPTCSLLRRLSEGGANAVQLASYIASLISTTC
jgi:hypothetical protein